MNEDVSDELMTEPTTEFKLRRLPSWREMNADTEPWAEALQLKFYREASPARKLEIAGDLIEGMLQLSETGLRNRHPNASPSEIKRRMADMMLGPELAEKVYGALENSL